MSQKHIVCNWPGGPEKGKQAQKQAVSLESDSAEEMGAEMPQHKKQQTVKVEWMPLDLPVGTSFLQAVMWVVWEMCTLQATIQEMGDYIREQLGAVRINVLDKV